MSQALQSLNSILKYKQERERQKIDRSLSMMDMATRLRQQQIENARAQTQLQLQQNREFREKEKFKMLKEDREKDSTYNDAIRALNISIKEEELIAKEFANKGTSNLLSQKTKLEAEDSSRKIFGFQETINNQKADVVINTFPLKNLYDAVVPITENVSLDEDYMNELNNAIDELESKSEKQFYRQLIKKDKSFVSAIGMYKANPNLGRDLVLSSMDNLINSMSKGSGSYDSSLTSNFTNFTGYSQDQLNNMTLSLDTVLNDIKRNKNLQFKSEMQNTIYDVQNKNLTKSARVVQDRLIARNQLRDVPDDEEEYLRLLEANPDLTPEEVFEGVPEQYLPDFYRRIIE